MKRFVVFSIGISVFCSFALPASDAPVARQPADLLFGVTDTANRFATSTCECSVTISENGKELLDEPLLPWTGGPSLFDYQMPFTFPDPAVYHIVMTGNSTASGTFQSFQVSYDERVHENPNDTSADSGLVFDFAMIGLVLLIAGSLYLCYKEAARQ